MSTNLIAPIWNIPYRRNQFFTGREEVFARLHDSLQRDATAALTQPQGLSGLGGIGKTQTALEYAYRYRHEYKAVLWDRAVSHRMIKCDIVTFAYNYFL